MTAVPSRPVLGLADDPGAQLKAADWIGSFVVLGSRLRRYMPKLDGRQLVVAVSVPRRDYVAVLVGAGWMLSSPAPEHHEPIEVFRAASKSTYIRAVTDHWVITGAFARLEENRPDPRVIIGGRQVLTARYKAVKVLNGPAQDVDRAEVPKPGFLACLTGAADTWLDRLASPPMDLALIGTAKWLRDDLETLVGNGTDGKDYGTPLRTYILPYGERAATWSTPVIPAVRLGEGETFPTTCQAAILDGYGAINHLNDITVPIVVCVVDRSIADESTAEVINDARLANSRPISMAEDLRWEPPNAVEVLAFAVAL